MAIFNQGPTANSWQPTELARGPFAGLQGGAVAGLLTAEIEAEARVSEWGEAISVSAWFLKAVPMTALRTEVTPVRTGGRIAFVDNKLWAEGEADACALVRVTLAQPRAVAVPGHAPPDRNSYRPLDYKVSRRAAPHGGAWFMDSMEVRPAGAISWFKPCAPVIEGAGPLAQLVGPADWAHGINRPVHDVVADPNPNLTVSLFRPPAGDWIGVQSQAEWDPARGVGMGSGALLDTTGPFGCVSMSVALTPFRKPAMERT